MKRKYENLVPPLLENRKCRTFFRLGHTDGLSGNYLHQA